MVKYFNFSDLLKDYNDNLITTRQFITYAYNFESEIKSLTDFLNDYNVTDLKERLYYLINGIHEVVKCKYCSNKATWRGRLNDGYRETCQSQKCKSKQMYDSRIGNTKVSDNRLYLFKKKLSVIDENTVINDDLIKLLLCYDKFLDLTDNQYVLNYLDKRYTDSQTRLETLQRIRRGIEEKPKCPVCGKPVNWVGREKRMFTKYCSSSCGARAKETTEKKHATQLEHWGTTGCYDSSKYQEYYKSIHGVGCSAQRQDVIEKRKETLIERLGTTNVLSIPEIAEKAKATFKSHYGEQYDYTFQLPEVRQKMYDLQYANSITGTSKAENIVYGYFKEIGYEPERFKMSEKYHQFHAVADFYLEEFDLYIEYQGSQYHHGSAWFGTETQMDELKRLKDKNNAFRNNGHEDNQYAGMIMTWTEIDVYKRKYAYENGINLLEIYECRNKEDLKKQLDFYIACKNKTDIPLHDKDEITDIIKKYQSMQSFKCLNINDLNDNNDNNDNAFDYMKIAEYFHAGKIFIKEMEAVYDCPTIRRFIIQSAMERHNKNECDLSEHEIFNEFAMINVSKRPEIVNPVYIKWFVDNYNIKVINVVGKAYVHYILGMVNCDKIICDIGGKEKILKNDFGLCDIRNSKCRKNADAWLTVKDGINSDIDDLKISGYIKKWKISKCPIYCIINNGEEIIDINDKVMSVINVNVYQIKSGINMYVLKKMN